jgi:hypothetical protein
MHPQVLGGFVCESKNRIGQQLDQMEPNISSYPDHQSLPLELFQQ